MSTYSKYTEENLRYFGSIEVCREEVTMEADFEARAFVRKRKDDGTIYSYCSRCFATVADTLSSDELDAAETGHKCDSLLLEMVQKYREFACLDSAA
jgi:hypothetical protein